MEIIALGLAVLLVSASAVFMYMTPIEEVEGLTARWVIGTFFFGVAIIISVMGYLIYEALLL